MASINDWATKAAQKIYDEASDAGMSCLEPEHFAVERIAAIIATYAKPLKDLLRESRREHRHNDIDSNTTRHASCCPQCCCESWPDDPEGDFEPTPNSDKPCDCGADEWNTRLDKILNGDGNERSSE